MKTTVIGSYPKPPYLDLPDWFKENTQNNTFTHTNNYLGTINQIKMESNIYKAIEDVIIKQKEPGIDIITDGEIRRENYIYSFCRCLNGIDFNNLTEKIYEQEFQMYIAQQLYQKLPIRKIFFIQMNGYYPMKLQKNIIKH